MVSYLIIEKVDVRAVNVPLEYPIHTAVGVVDTSPLVLVDILTNSSSVGKAYLFGYSPAMLSSLKSVTEVLSKLIVGMKVEPFTVNKLLEERFQLLGYTGLLRMAGSGIDMALWDVLAKSAGLPLYKFLGGGARKIKSYDSHSMDGVSLAAQRAEASVEQGFRGIKTKIGYETLEEDLNVVLKLREVVGDNVDIMVDYNQSLTVPEAKKRIKVLEAEGIAWVEEPVSYFDDDACEKVRSASNVAIQIGENWLGTEQMIKSLRAEACDLSMPDVMKIGGVTGWLKASALCEAFAQPMSSHLFQEYSAHLLAVSPTAHWLERMDIAKAVVDSSLTFVDGDAVLSDEHGAGFVWKESEIEKYIV